MGRGCCTPAQEFLVYFFPYILLVEVGWFDSQPPLVWLCPLLFMPLLSIAIWQTILELVGPPCIHAHDVLQHLPSFRNVWK